MRLKNNVLDKSWLWWNQRLELADWLEIRLDATLVVCYVLSRFLLYDVTTGAKAVPGLELHDWIQIWSTVSSASVLALYWTQSGFIVTQSFENSVDKDEGHQLRDCEKDDGSIGSSILSSQLALTSVNVTVAAPLWLVTEQALDFGPPGMEAVYSAEVYLPSTVGIASVMVLARLTSRGWR